MKHHFFFKYITLYLHLIFSTRLSKNIFPEEDYFVCDEKIILHWYVVIEG